MKFNCSICHDPLLTKGALVYSPPLNSTDIVDTVEKYHICVNCWKNLSYFMTNRRFAISVFGKDTTYGLTNEEKFIE
jgi:hypothetical protein